MASGWKKATLVEVKAPYDGTVIGRVYQGRRQHAEAAIAASVKAFGTTRRSQRSSAKGAPPGCEGIAQRKEEFSRTLCQEAGKPIKAARMEVERAIFTFTVAAEESTRNSWRVPAARLAGVHAAAGVL